MSRASVGRVKDRERAGVVDKKTRTVESICLTRGKIFRLIRRPRREVDTLWHGKLHHTSYLVRHPKIW